MQTETMHIGRKICRIRELKGMKQETLAAEMGVSQQAVSKLEQSEHIDDDRLEIVAEKLGVTVDAIKNFSEESAVNYFNTFNDNSVNQGAVYAFNSNFNPLNELMKTIEENKQLYERLLQAEKEKVQLLERLLQERNEKTA